MTQSFCETIAAKAILLNAINKFNIKKEKKKNAINN